MQGFELKITPVDYRGSDDFMKTITEGLGFRVQGLGFPFPLPHFPQAPVNKSGGSQGPKKEGGLKDS